MCAHVSVSMCVFVSHELPVSVAGKWPMWLFLPADPHSLSRLPSTRCLSFCRFHTDLRWLHQGWWRTARPRLIWGKLPELPSEMDTDRQTNTQRDRMCRAGLASQTVLRFLCVSFLHFHLHPSPLHLPLSFSPLSSLTHYLSVPFSLVHSLPLCSFSPSLSRLSFSLTP